VHTQSKLGRTVDFARECDLSTAIVLIVVAVVIVVIQALCDHEGPLASAAEPLRFLKLTPDVGVQVLHVHHLGDDSEPATLHGFENAASKPGIERTRCG
jgi:hypothetical protein